ncbi:MAG TPA: multicopper oxidase domain-containing protein [Bryobacteraceae bacterium]|nr:multicopper oxidase domain-containing protein [Bryobacteraceae bacterium]
MLTRRSLLQAAIGAVTNVASAYTPVDQSSDYTIDIAPYSLEVAPHNFVQTVAYNGQVPGPVIRLQVDKPVTLDVRNQSGSEEIVHWHGLLLPSEVDGAMEEGTPMIAPGASARLRFVPAPAGFRWYHTHTFAGKDLKKAQYTGQHGFLLIEPRDNPGRYDAEMFLALHDWKGQLLGGGDGSLMVSYDVSTINGRVLGFGEPLRVKQGQRVLFHILNSSATDVHWVSLAGHTFEVIALDGNPVAVTRQVNMLRLVPAERVCAIVEMKNPGVWVLGEVRKHIRAAGMGIVVEYAGQTAKPTWIQPQTLDWSYEAFGAGPLPPTDAIDVPLVFRSKFTGHGDVDHWMINGKSFPHTDTVKLRSGARYRLLFRNESLNDHPVHLHRHLFAMAECGVLKDTVLVPSKQELAVEFTANNPGKTLFHCHQQDHMDAGFMMLFDYV